jgi:hypothetical protein
VLAPTNGSLAAFKAQQAALLQEIAELGGRVKASRPRAFPDPRGLGSCAG